MSGDTIEKTFQVAAPARLILSNIRGSVIIRPGALDVIQVKAVKHGGFDNGKDAVEIEQDSDGTVRVETRSHEAMFGFLSHPPRVDYTLEVPQDIHLDASCISSSLEINGLKGVFKLKTVSGDMKLDDLSGSFRFNAVSGKINGSHLEGVLELEAVSGGARLLESNFPSADASTVSGNLTLQTSLADGPYQFGSVSGDVRLLVPADTRCNAELKSVSGSIRSSLPAITSRIGHGMKVTQIQGGGTAVRLKSVSGDLSIETEGVPATAIQDDEPAPERPLIPVPPVPAREPEPPPLSTAEILQRIERGEMTVDEAIRLMKNQD